MKKKYWFVLFYESFGGYGIGFGYTVLWLYESFETHFFGTYTNLSHGYACECAFKVRDPCTLTPCSSLVCGWDSSGSLVSPLKLSWDSSQSSGAESTLTAGQLTRGCIWVFLEGCP